MMRELEDAVIHMPNSSILLETDSPYIRINGNQMPITSLTLYDVVKQIATMKGTTVEQVADVVAENFGRLFYWG